MFRVPLKSILFCAVALSASSAAAALEDSLPALEIVGRLDPAKIRLSAMLRLGFENLERGEMELARENFESARKMDPQNPMAFLGLGRSFLDRESNKIALLQAIERLFKNDYLSRSIGYFKKALDLDPRNSQAHFWLGSAYMRTHDEDDLKKALYHLEEALRLGGASRDLNFKLAMLHKSLGDIDDAERILSDLEKIDNRRIDPLACLELAKISVARRQFEQAIRYYWRGLEMISNQEEFKAYLDDLAMIASENEIELFKNTVPTNAAQVLRSFWLSRDHSMGLPPGTRLLSHYTRLNVADSLFRLPYGKRNPLIGPTVAYYPDKNVPFDDRGIVFLRHGWPDKKLRYMGERIEPNETWIYYGDKNDLILHFAALNGNREFQLVNTLDGLIKGKNFVIDVDTDSNEDETAPRDDEEANRLTTLRELYDSRLEVGESYYPRLYQNPGDVFARIQEYENSILDVWEAVNTESVEFPFRSRLESFYDLVDLRGPSQDTTDLEFFTGIPGSAISYEHQAANYIYDIFCQLVVYDQSWKLVDRFENVEHFETLINPGDLMDKLVVSLGKVELIPGDYFYFVKIQNGLAAGCFNGQIHVDSFAGDSLQTSEIITADNIVTAASDSSKFRRYSLEVHPKPSRIFHPSEKLYAYQEIYNLRPDAQGNLSYRTTYTISSLQRDHNVFGKVIDSFKSIVRSGGPEDRVVLSVEKKKIPVSDKLVHEDLAIDISSSPDGLYELSIQIEDLNRGGKMAQRNTRFFVKK